VEELTGNRRAVNNEKLENLPSGMTANTEIVLNTFLVWQKCSEV
jgi:hypothetical protein